MVAAIRLSAVVGEDRKLVIELPPDAPTGNVEVIVSAAEPVEEAAEQIVVNLAREAARAKLLAAGFLVTTIRAPEGTKPHSAEEILRLGTLPPGARPSEDIIDEIRGEY